MNPFVSKASAYLLVIGAALLLAACATPTPYQSATADKYGYAEQPLEDNRYRVTFKGNRATSRETVENYLLLRAADLTLERGGDYFRVVEKSIERSGRYYTTGFPGFGHHGHFGGFHHGLHGRGFGGYGHVTTSRSDRYSAYANITLHTGEDPEDDAQAYDASQVRERLEPTLGVEGEG